METIEEKTLTLVDRNLIPIIDVGHITSKIQHIDFCTRKEAKKLNKSLASHGFALLVGHGIKEARLQEAYKKIDKFYKLSDEEKLPFCVREKEEFHGYVMPGKEKLSPKKLFEVRHSYNFRNFKDNMPDEVVPEFSEKIQSLAEDFKSLATIMLQFIAIGFDLDKNILLNYHELILSEKDSSVFRLIYYPEIEETCPPNSIRCDEHTDYGTFTLLSQDSEGGLEVMYNNAWERVGHLQGSILINVGDMLQAWTGNKFKALKHRVIIPDEKKIRYRARHSGILFVHPNQSVSLSPIPGLADEIDIKSENHVPLTAHEYLLKRYNETYS